MIWTAQFQSNTITILGARTWFIARRYAAVRFGVSPDAIRVTPAS